MAIRLALHGKAFSGKSTIARALVEEDGFTLVNFTDYLKGLYVTALNAIGVQVEMADVLAHKNEERPFIISLGTRIGFDEGVTIQKQLAEELGDTWPERIVFDNVRFPQQMDRLLHHDFQLVRVTISDQEQERRAIASGMRYNDLLALRQSDTERPLPPSYGGIWLDGNEPHELVMDQLRSRIGLALPAGV